MLKNLGISTSYFAARGFSIYESVKKAYQLGFRIIELGANHNQEKEIWPTFKKIKTDFPKVIFTQHCYFPPILGNFFSNPAEGLTPKNKRLIEAIFEAAKILKTQIISFHSGLNAKFSYKGEFREWQGFKEFAVKEKISQKRAKKGLEDFIEYVLGKAKEEKIKIAMENIVGHQDYSTTLTSFSDFKEFFGKFPDLNFLFDYGHGFIVHGEKTDEFFSFGEKIIEMHLDDVNQKGHDHRVLGKGILNLKNLFSYIKGLPKMPFLILEHSAEVKEEEIKEEIRLIERLLS